MVSILKTDNTIASEIARMASALVKSDDISVLDEIKKLASALQKDISIVDDSILKSIGSVYESDIELVDAVVDFPMFEIGDTVSVSDKITVKYCPAPKKRGIAFAPVANLKMSINNNMAGFLSVAGPPPKKYIQPAPQVTRKKIMAPKKDVPSGQIVSERDHKKNTSDREVASKVLDAIKIISTVVIVTAIAGACVAIARKMRKRR